MAETPAWHVPPDLPDRASDGWVWEDAMNALPPRLAQLVEAFGLTTATEAEGGRKRTLVQRREAAGHTEAAAEALLIHLSEIVAARGAAEAEDARLREALGAAKQSIAWAARAVDRLHTYLVKHGQADSSALKSLGGLSEALHVADVGCENALAPRAAPAGEVAGA